jgi:hypothetical protein
LPPLSWPSTSEGRVPQCEVATLKFKEAENDPLQSSFTQNTDLEPSLAKCKQEVMSSKMTLLVLASWLDVIKLVVVFYF